MFNNIKIRPVYLYFFNNKKYPRWYDIFSKKINSHNLFEFKWNGKWYVMRTNTKLEKFVSLDQYINNSDFVPSNAKYIRFLNNRNVRIITPFWIPDIY